jgi:hypothetical protein
MIDDLDEFARWLIAHGWKVARCPRHTGHVIDIYRYVPDVGVVRWAWYNDGAQALPDRSGCVTHARVIELYSLRNTPVKRGELSSRMFDCLAEITEKGPDGLLRSCLNAYDRQTVDGLIRRSLVRSEPVGKKSTRLFARMDLALAALSSEDARRHYRTHQRPDWLPISGG